MDRGNAVKLSVRLALLAGAVTLLPGQLTAQALRFPTGDTQQDSTQAVPAAPTAIPISEIPLRADEAFARMRSLETQIGADPDVRLIENNMPDELRAIAIAHDRIGRIVLEHLSLRELRVLTEIWGGHEDRLVGWANTFEHEWLVLESASSSMSGIRRDWELTRDSAVADAATPREVLDRIETVIAATDSLDTGIRGELSYLLGLETQVTGALEGVREVVRELDDAQASVRGRMFHQNHPPLWRLTESDEESASTIAARLWKEDWEATKSFLAENQERTFFLLLVFLLLTVAAVRLRSRIEAESIGEDESLRGAVETLSRPFAAAMLITMILSNFVIPRAPVNAWQVIAVASVVPLYRLLPTSSSPLVNRTMRVLLLLFAAGAIGDLALPPSLEHRLFTLALGIAIVVGAVGLLRGTDRDQARQTTWGWLVWQALRGVTIIIGFAVLAGVFGWTLIVEMLVYGVITSAYLALVLVVGYRVLAGIVRLLPYSAYGKASHVFSIHGDLISQRVLRLLKIAAALVWVWIVLETFWLTGPIYRWVEGLLTGSISVGIIEFSLGRILAFLIVLLLTVWIARLLRFVLDVEILPRLELKRGVGNAISTVVQWTVLGLGLLAAAGALGLGGQQLAIVAGALGVGIGFGLQNIVNNFVSGLILIFEQPVKVGDKVEITKLALTGEVKRIGIRASVVRSFDGAEVIVPNANLISSEVVNWTLSDQRRRIHTEVGVSYGTDPHRVREILKGVATAHPDVLRYPEPLVLFLGFGASSLDFRLLSWTANFDDFLRLRSDLATATHDALKEAGITIPFPQRDLHVKSLPSSGLELTAGAGAPVPEDPKGLGKEPNSEH